MANPNDQRCVAVLLRPFDCFSLRLEGGKKVVGMVLDNIAKLTNLTARESTMSNVYIEPRPKGRPEGDPIDDFGLTLAGCSISDAR
jgi:hypothetical protein